MERKECLFLARLIGKPLQKFQIENVNIQCLLAKKVDFEVHLSESHLEEYHKVDKEILQQFSSFTLKVKDIRCSITLAQDSSTKWELLNYLEKDYTNEEKNNKWPKWAGIPERSDYIVYYVLHLDIDEVFLSKWGNELGA